MGRRLAALGALTTMMLSTAAHGDYDKYKKLEGWQTDWSTGLVGAEAGCIRHQVVRGDHCGDPESISVPLENTCDHAVRVHYCFEKKTGKLSCGLDSEMKPGAKNHGAWSCKVTGKWRAEVCKPDEKCRVDRILIMTRKDDSVILNSCMKRELGKVAEAFHEATGKGLQVTDGQRTPKRQAEEMHALLANGKDLQTIYGEKTLAKEIQDAWKKLPEADRASKGVATVEDVIAGQVKDKKYVSRHLRGSAADLDTSSLTEDELEKLKKALADAKIDVFDETKKAGSPHFHVNVKACDT